MGVRGQLKRKNEQNKTMIMEESISSNVVITTHRGKIDMPPAPVLVVFSHHWVWRELMIGIFVLAVIKIIAQQWIDSAHNPSGLETFWGRISTLAN